MLNSAASVAKFLAVSICLCLTASCSSGSSTSSSGDSSSATPTSPAALPTLQLAASSVTEGNTGTSNLVFAATLSAASASAITVDFTTADATALAASDYTATNGTLTIAAANTTGTVTVTVNAETLLEADETLTLTLSNPTGAVLGTAVATGTILNDDTAGLNDTGVILWGNSSVSNLTSTQSTFPLQDADVGRDANSATNSNADGKAGFSFTKLDATGQPLTNQAVLYTTTAWNCVQDNVTGLMWEVKTTSGAGGLRDTSYNYTWLDSDNTTNGGAVGTPNGGTCVDGNNCDTEKYVAAVNAVGFCGKSDWRLPNKNTLLSIVDFSIAPPAAAIDTDYFPNSINGIYWSSSPGAYLTNTTWSVYFQAGGTATQLKSSTYSVRLVRDGL